MDIDSKPSKLVPKRQSWKLRVDERAFWFGLWLTNRATRTVAHVAGSVGLDALRARKSLATPKKAD
jgi:hypothetical protein